MFNMNWNTTERMSAIDLIALKVMTEQNPFQRIRALTVIRALTWTTPHMLNGPTGEISNWLTPEELQKIKLS
jgi:hypothetical protein